NLGDGSGMIAVDGGVGANNPTVVALVEAMKHFPGKEVLLVTLGTGKTVRPFPTSEALSWGVLGWAVPIIDVVFDAQASLVAEEMAMLLPPGHAGLKRRFRFQANLDGASDVMDDVSPANLAALEKAGRDLIDARKDDLKQLCELLLAAN